MLNRLASELRYRLRMVFHRDAVDREIDDELRFHLEREAEKYVRGGAAPDDARRRASLALGGVNRTKDDTRDAHGTVLFDQMMQDVRYALRGLRARPLFTAVVVTTLALGVGVNAAMFSVIDRLMLRPPAHLRDPGTVHRLFVTWTGSDGERSPQGALEYARYLDFARWSRKASQFAAFANRQLAVGEGDAARELTVGVVSASFFDFFDAPPTVGRYFSADEDQLPEGSAVAVLGYSFWKSQYAGQRSVVGSSIKIGRGSFTVIGVAAKDFAGVSDGATPVAFIPIARFASLQNRNFYTGYRWSWMNVVARRKPGVSVQEFSADLSSAFVRSWNAEREEMPRLPSAEAVKPTAIAAPVLLARGPTAGPASKVLLWVSGVAFVVLLVACANVANLLLARALRRRRELAVRRALGGSRARLVRQLLTETLLLSFIGGAAGLIGAQLASGVVRRLFAPDAPSFTVLTDARTIAFAFALTALTALLAGLVPALHSGREDLSISLRGGMRDAAYRGARSRQILLVFQTALSVVLLVGAGLFLRSVQSVRAMRLGFDANRVVYAEMNTRGVQMNDVEQRQLAERVLAAARTIPGVEHASFTMSVPYWSFEGRNIRVPGIDSVQKLGRFQLQAGSTEYFATMGTRILRGRGFSADDRANAPFIAVVSQSMARVLWPGEEPIGKRFKVGPDSAPWTTVVGVAENVHAEKITNDGELAYYLPIEQYAAEFGGSVPYLYVRVRGAADDYVEAVRARLQREMPGASYIVTVPLHAMVDPEMRSWTSGATMFSALGGLALALAAIGLYAVIAFSVAQRTQELGVRVALGALPRDVRRLVVGEGVRVTLFGVVAGAAIALVAGRGIDPLLFGTTSRDPSIYAMVAAVLVAVGIAASFIPASRAARVDPNVALRAE